MTDKQRKLAKVVALYRHLGKPDLLENDRYFSVDNKPCDSSLLQLLNEVQDDLQCVTTIKVNGTPSSDLPRNCKKIYRLSCSIKVPTMPAPTFYANTQSLAESFRPIQKGQFPPAYYLVDKDFAQGESEEPEDLRRLRQITEFVGLLKDLLPHTEDNPNANWYRFVLLSNKPDGKSFDKLTFKSKFSFDDAKIADLSEISRLHELSKAGDLHSHERIIVFRNALAELARNEPDEDKVFSYLLRHFSRLIELYDNNYETYINNFVLEDFKKEVIESYSEFGETLDAIINDATTKAFVMPAALTAVALIARLEQVRAQEIMAFVILLTIVISNLQMTWYLAGLRHVETSMDDVFGKFKGKSEAGAEYVTKKCDALRSRISAASFRIYAFLAISWVIAPITFLILI